MTARATSGLRISLRNSQERKILDSFYEGYKSKLKGRIYGVLCEREKNGDWEKFLDSILVELMGMENIDSINYWALRAKLASLKFLSYEYFRKTIFESINLVEGLQK